MPIAEIPEESQKVTVTCLSEEQAFLSFLPKQRIFLTNGLRTYYYYYFNTGENTAHA
jgi:hypothetical protein